MSLGNKQNNCHCPKTIETTESSVNAGFEAASAKALTFKFSNDIYSSLCGYQSTVCRLVHCSSLILTLFQSQRDSAGSRWLNYSRHLHLMILLWTHLLLAFYCLEENNIPFDSHRRLYMYSLCGFWCQIRTIKTKSPKPEQLSVGRIRLISSFAFGILPLVFLSKIVMFLFIT